MLDRSIDPNCTDEKGVTLSDVILLAQGTDVSDIRLLDLLTERPMRLALFKNMLLTL